MSEAEARALEEAIQLSLVESTRTRPSAAVLNNTSAGNSGYTTHSTTSFDVRSFVFYSKTDFYFFVFR